jgi:hypothetical protein
MAHGIETRRESERGGNLCTVNCLVLFYVFFFTLTKRESFKEKKSIGALGSRLNFKELAEDSWAEIRRICWNANAF